MTPPRNFCENGCGISSRTRRTAVRRAPRRGLGGPQVCQQVRGRADPAYTYLILLKAKSEKEELAKGLEAGGDDFLSKPFRAEELRARALMDPVETREGPVSVALSLGVAASEAVTGVDPDSLLRAADTALSQTKRQGRNRVEVASAVEVPLTSAPTGPARRRTS